MPDCRPRLPPPSFRVPRTPEQQQQFTTIGDLDKLNGPGAALDPADRPCARRRFGKAARRSLARRHRVRGTVARLGIVIRCTSVPPPYHAFAQPPVCRRVSYPYDFQGRVLIFPEVAADARSFMLDSCLNSLGSALIGVR